MEEGKLVDGAMPKPSEDLARIFFLAMAAGGFLLGWLNNRGRWGHRGETSGDGSDSDDGLHHGSWWGLWRGRRRPRRGH